MSTEHLSAIRDQLHKVGTCELFMQNDNEGVRDLWQERQALIAEMTKATAEAVGRIQAEYAQRLRDIDQQYVMYLQLSMPRSEDV